MVLPRPPSGTTRLATPFPVAKTISQTPSWETVSTGAIQRHPQEIRDSVIHSSWLQPRAGQSFAAQNLQVSTETAAHYRLPLDAPGNAICETRHTITIHRPDGCAEIDSRVTAAGGRSAIGIDAQLRATWNGAVEYRRAWAYEA